MITLMLIAFAATSSVLTQGSSSTKKGAAKSSTANDASQPKDDDFIELLRKDERSQKKQLIAQNMDLSDAEVEKFWPVYDQYAAELSRIYDTKNCPAERRCRKLQQHDGCASRELHPQAR